jgi:hypothetical protein
MSQVGLATGISILVAFAFINHVSFDAFSIARDRRQAFVLMLHYVALAAPFFFAGMALGDWLDAFPQTAGITYAVNLLEATLGCLIALVRPAYLGGEGMVSRSAALVAVISSKGYARRHERVREGQLDGRQIGGHAAGFSLIARSRTEACALPAMRRWAARVI